jgi:ribosomal protein L40E
MSAYHVVLALDVAAACALAVGVILFVVALSRALASDPDLVVPAIDQGEQEKAHPVGPGDFVPDLAWPFYPFRQSRADLKRIQANLAVLNSGAWRRPSRAFFQKPGWWVVFPIPIAVIAFLSLASLMSWICCLVYALVHGMTVGASQVLLVPAATALRAAERWRRGRLLTQGACMRCFHVTPWPAYQCPGCQRRHHDVRPGRLGLLLRRCVCGTHLVTMASRTAWQVTPLCQRCGAELPAGAGGVRDIRVPVFGDISAGKTRFLYASLSSLMQTAGRTRLEVTFPDEGSRQLAEFGLGVISSGSETAKTSTNAQVTLTCRLGGGRRSELVHLFDAAGEHFRAARQPDALRFLDDGQGLVYVLDPFSIPAVRKRLDGRDSTPLQLAHAAAGDPELTYDEVVSRLRDSGVPARAQRLAVVISKADLLRSAGLDLPVGSGEIAQWLRDLGVHNLVMSARHEFAAVRFFTVASQDVAPGHRDDPGAPLRWLLTSHGSRLPADPADAAGDPGSPGRHAASGRPGHDQSKPVEAKS